MSSDGSAVFFNLSRKATMVQLQREIDSLHHQLTSCQNEIENAEIDSAYRAVAQERLEELCDKQSAKHEEFSELQKETQDQLQELLSTVEEYQEEFDDLQKALSTQRANLANSHLATDNKVDKMLKELEFKMQDEIIRVEDFASTQVRNVKDQQASLRRLLLGDMDQLRATLQWNNAQAHSTIIAGMEEACGQMQAKILQLQQQLNTQKVLNRQLKQQLRKLQATQQMEVRNLDVAINGACGRIFDLNQRFNNLHAAQEHSNSNFAQAIGHIDDQLRSIFSQLPDQNQGAAGTLELQNLKKFVRFNLQAEKAKEKKNKRQFRHFMKKLSGMRKEFFLGGAIFTLGPALLRALLGAMVTTLL